MLLGDERAVLVEPAAADQERAACLRRRSVPSFPDRRRGTAPAPALAPTSIADGSAAAQPSRRNTRRPRCVPCAASASTRRLDDERTPRRRFAPRAAEIAVTRPRAIAAAAAGGAADSRAAVPPDDVPSSRSRKRTARIHRYAVQPVAQEQIENSERGGLGERPGVRRRARHNRDSRSRTRTRRSAGVSPSSSSWCMRNSGSLKPMPPG